MRRPKIRKGDEVLVIAGRNRGVRGRVLRVLPAEDRAIVERVNLVRRHTRPNPQKAIQGGVLEKEAPIHISNLMLIDPKTGTRTRVGRKRTGDGKAVRIAKKSGVELG